MAMKDDLDDERLAKLYRESAGAVPPEHLDAGILAAARKAVENGPRPASPFSGRWQVPAALAAVLLVTVLLVPLVPDPGDEPALSQHGTPAEVLRKKTKSNDDAAERYDRSSPVLEEADAVSPRRQLRDSPAAPGAELRRSLPAVPAERLLEQKRPASAPVSTMHSDVSGAEADWLERISQLLEAGDEAGALDQLQAFTRRYPDYALPAELQAFQERHSTTKP